MLDGFGAEAGIFRRSTDLSHILKRIKTFDPPA
jgi:hypothetical protein